MKDRLRSWRLCLPRYERLCKGGEASNRQAQNISRPSSMLGQISGHCCLQAHSPILFRFCVVVLAPEERAGYQWAFILAASLVACLFVSHVKSGGSAETSSCMLEEGAQGKVRRLLPISGVHSPTRACYIWLTLPAARFSLLLAPPQIWAQL